MELIIALVLFAAIVVSWIVLPSSPAEKTAGKSGAPAAATKAGHTA